MKTGCCWLGWLGSGKSISSTTSSAALPAPVPCLRGGSAWECRESMEQSIQPRLGPGECRYPSTMSSRQLLATSCPAPGASQESPAPCSVAAAWRVPNLIWGVCSDCVCARAFPEVFCQPLALQPNLPAGLTQLGTAVDPPLSFSSPSSPTPSLCTVYNTVLHSMEGQRWGCYQLSLAHC